MDKDKITEILRIALCDAARVSTNLQNRNYTLASEDLFTEVEPYINHQDATRIRELEEALRTIQNVGSLKIGDDRTHQEVLALRKIIEMKQIADKVLTKSALSQKEER